MNTSTALAFHIKKESVINFFSNMLFNGGVCYYNFYDVARILPWGFKGFVFDLLVTTFALCLLMSVFVAWIHHRKRHLWTLSAPANILEKWVDTLPPGVWLASFGIGLFGTALVLILVLILLVLDSLIGIKGVEYAFIKGFTMGSFAMLVTPMAIRRGLNYYPNNENAQSNMRNQV